MKKKTARRATFPGQADLMDKDAFCARVKGDKMEPLYHEGDIVTFSPSAGPRNGDDCFIRFDDNQTTFKRVYFEVDKKGKSIIRLKPRNERYRPVTVASEKITGIWRASFKYSMVNVDPAA